MRSQDKEHLAGAAEILAALSRCSTRRGDAALARTRLIECLRLLHSAASDRSGAVALGAAAELASATGQLERAVEFCGACERMLQSSRTPEDPRVHEQRGRTLERLRSTLGDERFEAAWRLSQRTPFPFEFYVSTALHWLERLDARRLQQVAPSEVGDSAAPAVDSGNPGSTALLIARARAGSSAARERLSGRYLEALRRFAHGRLPNYSRDLMDTSDLVQVTAIRALEKLPSLHPKKKGDFFAYLRRILINQVRDEIRRVARKPKVSGLSEAIPSGAASPLEEMLGVETLEAYRSALSALSARQQEAFTLRIEQGLSYQEVADVIGLPSANAARMAVSRALELVAKSLRTP